MRKLKLFTLGLVLCFTLAIATGCGERADNDQTENTDNKDDSTVNDATKGTAKPNSTDDGNVGSEIVDTVDDVGTDVVDGVTDVADEMMGDDASDAPASKKP